MLRACLRKDENHCVKKCMDYEVNGVRPRGSSKKTWSEAIEKDCQIWQMCKKDAMDSKEMNKIN